MRSLLIILLIPVIRVYSQDQVRDTVTQLEEVILYDPIQRNTSLGITPSSIIREKAFQNHSPVDLQSSINQISGVYVLSGALNTNRITIRGVGARTPFGTDKLRLYFNGIPVTNGTGSSTMEAFDLENLASVEVIKGPKGTAYSSSLGGAILLNTKSSERRETRLQTSFTLGSYNLQKNNTLFSLSDEHWVLDLNYNRLRTDGYRENNSFERDGLLLNAGYKFNNDSQISLLVNYIDYTAQIPSSLGATAFAEDPTQAAFTWAQAQGFEANRYTLVGLSYSNKLTDKLKYEHSIFYTYLDHYEPRPFNILDEFTNGYGFRSVFRGNMGKLSRMNYTFGAELYKDEYNWGTYENLYRDNNGEGSLQGEQLSDNKEYRRQFNAFATLHIPFSKAFTAQLGLNINKTVYDFRDLFNIGASSRSARRNFDIIALPSLDVQYNVGKGNSLYANISRGFSNPSLEETLTPDGVINPDIRQETGMNYELGTKIYSSNGKFWMTASLFRMNIKNLLVAERVGDDQFIGRNAGRTRHQGLELDMNLLLNLSNSLDFIPFLSYSLSDHSFVEFLDAGEDFSGNPLTGVPKHRANFGLRIKNNEGFYWNNTFQYVDEIPLRDDNSLTSDSFTVYNTRMGIQKKLGSSFRVNLNAGVNNVFNVRYAQSVLINAASFGGNEPRYFYPGNDRNFYANISLNYTL
ncbi:TonB-dependent receptor family protein [Lentiprolixibacter aurantiacus]|uniref:TonB-dependent receptor family protein n=1 Tax=Lentiprolixibacter aurantiacus TaxID=2993939 RepID=UPI003F6F961D